MVEHIRGLQRAMFRGFNALRLFDMADKKIISRIVIPQSRHMVFQIRRDIDKIIQEISTELGGDSHVNPPVPTGYEDFLSTEREAARLREQYIQPGEQENSELADTEKVSNKGSSLPDDVEKNLSSMTTSSIREIDTKIMDDSDEFVKETSENPGIGEDAFIPDSSDSPDSKSQILKLKKDYIAMQRVQSETLHSILTVIQQSPGRRLRVEEKLPSLLERYGIEDSQQSASHLPTASQSQRVQASGSGHGHGPGSSMRTDSILQRRHVTINDGNGDGEYTAGHESKQKPERPSRTETKEKRAKLEQDQAELVERTDLVQLSRSLSTIYTLFFSTE